MKKEGDKIPSKIESEFPMGPAVAIAMAFIPAKLSKLLKSIVVDQKSRRTRCPEFCPGLDVQVRDSTCEVRR
jgi:hypothetical protein